jgi:hypothetical protein
MVYKLGFLEFIHHPIFYKSIKEHSVSETVSGPEEGNRSSFRDVAFLAFF